MNRFVVLIYGVFVYIIFLATLAYLIGFTGNLYVPKSIDGALETSLWKAVGTNILLITLFGIQHSLMARLWFKKWWTKYIPEPVERSTYVLFTCLILMVLFYFWQPTDGYIWVIKNGYLRGLMLALFALGWLIMLISSFIINHFDLFGLRQVYLYFQGKTYTPLRFRINQFYNFIRHPLYLGFLLAFWSAPSMSTTRLLFAIGMTIYVFLGIRWEEKDLLKIFGERYRLYRDRVPKIIPMLSVKKWQKPDYESIIKKEKEFED